jgi:hypothetical protein
MLLVRRAAVDSQERELRLSGILTTASPDAFKQSKLLSTIEKLCKRLAGDGKFDAVAARAAFSSAQVGLSKRL